MQKSENGRSASGPSSGAMVHLSDAGADGEPESFCGIDLAEPPRRPHEEAGDPVLPWTPKNGTACPGCVASAEDYVQRTERTAVKPGMNR